MTCVKPLLLSHGRYACGKCIACRVTRSAEWTARITHELDYYPERSFLTFTYDEEHMPKNGSLNKVELQKLFKRIRKNYGIEFKYFACGQYGEEYGRPHYHAIMLGIGPKWEGFKWIPNPQRKPIAEVKEWIHGSVFVGTVTTDSIRYVTDYVLKKLSGPLADQVYGLREPPFQLVSQGIGKRFVAKNAGQLKMQGSMTLRSVQLKLPRYYKTKLDVESDSAFSDQLKEKAILVEKARFASLMEQCSTGDPYVIKEMIEKERKQKERNLEAKSNLRRRKR